MTISVESSELAEEITSTPQVVRDLRSDCSLTSAKIMGIIWEIPNESMAK